MALNNILSKLFGNKSQRDLKEINPYVQKILAIYPSVKSLSNDQLRGRTQELMILLEEKIKELKASIESIELENREKIWNEIDKIEKDIIEKQEKILDEILPEVFAIVKDTA